MKGGRRSEFHDDPIPHLVVDQETWDDLKSVLSSASTRDTFDVSGQIGVMEGVPVYIDACPWAGEGTDG